ncbi:RNA polymerase sigma factor [Sphingobacterium rhinopitheci]|uniref:RNA polymerase sigma factor n=1 Tax=Sphingobacterium rhinopitheci TaxID=2781960 RepID=UPI001F527628|nr:sigma-70 family RNA polymerase sigma factor [Sphingobacterium rhinopitheci]MCI0922345.1 sigma-70 family RNA polymerase sigma factor [Sphingobacterium rhinopitheci]
MYNENKILLKRLNDGDLDAFNCLYRTYAPKIYIRLIKLVKDPNIAEELLQDVFLKIWRNRSKIDISRGFISFINHIADNLAIDLFRKLQRDKILQIEIWASAVELYYHTEEDMISKETKQILENAINSLSPRKKEILILNKIQNKSYKEIAEDLNISVSTVSNQLVSAIKDVKFFIQKNYRNEYIMTLLIIYFNKN